MATEKLELMCAVGVWALVADNDVKIVEKSLLLNCLENAAGGTFDKDWAVGEIAQWLKGFESDFPATQDKLMMKIKNTRGVPVYKEELIDLAQRIIVSDAKLKDREELAMTKLHEWLG